MLICKLFLQLCQLKLNLTRAYFFAAFRCNDISANHSYFAYFQPCKNKFVRSFVNKTMLFIGFAFCSNSSSFVNGLICQELDAALQIE